MKKNLLLKLFIGGLLVLGLSACGQGGSKETNGADDVREEVENGQNESTDKQEVKNEDGKELKSTEAKFNGIIDTHSIEVEVDGEITVFQYNEKTADIINSLKEGSTVQITYYENEHGQFVIEEIK